MTTGWPREGQNAVAKASTSSKTARRRRKQTACVGRNRRERARSTNVAEIDMPPTLGRVRGMILQKGPACGQLPQEAAAAGVLVLFDSDLVDVDGVEDFDSLVVLEEVLLLAEDRLSVR